jgi:hypothetical protein
VVGAFAGEFRDQDGGSAHERRRFVSSGLSPAAQRR